MLRARLDLTDEMRGRRDPRVPPRRKNLPSQVSSVGERVVDLMIDPGGLRPDARVLDIGCGPGRTAVALARYLDPDRGSYEGFDVMPESIRWCRERIAPRHPRFGFRVAEVQNAQYNPNGSQTADEYEFPYADGEFTFAAAVSVFTHLQPVETVHYLWESARVLVPGGRLLATFFLIDDEVEDAIAAGKASRAGLFDRHKKPLRLDYELTDRAGHRFRADQAEVPEHLIALQRSDAISHLRDSGFEPIAVVRGSWSGLAATASSDGAGGLGQDVVIAERRVSAQRRT